MEFEAMLARSEKRLEDALLKYDEIISFAKRYYGNRHVNTLVQEVGKASVLRELDQPKQAIPIYREVIEIMQESDKKYTTIHAIIFNLASAYLQINQPEEAIRILLEDLNDIEDHYSIPYAELCMAIAKGYRQLQKPKEEKQYLLLSKPVFEKYYGSDHPKTIYVNDRLKELEDR